MSLLNNNRLISKFSIWVVNLLILGVFIVFVVNISAIYKILTPLEPIEDLRGVETWSTRVTLNYNGYELNKELYYTSDDDQPFSTDLYLSVPGPLVSRMTNDLENDNFKIRSRDESQVKAIISDTPSPVKFKFESTADQNLIIFLYLTHYVLALILTLIWFWYLRALIKNISTHQFFVSKNVKNLIILATPLLIIPFVQFAAEKIATNYFIKHFQVMNGGLTRITDLNIMPVVFGLIFLMMAGIIREGIKLKEEQDLTI